MKICEFFLQRRFEMAATVMTFAFGTIHHCSSLETNLEACLCSSLNRSIQNVTEHYVNHNILVYNNKVLKGNMNTN